jgi:hypothetical protein
VKGGTALWLATRVLSQEKGENGVNHRGRKKSDSELKLKKDRTCAREVKSEKKRA